VPLPASQGDWSIAKGGAAVTNARYEAGPIGLPTIAGTGDVTRWGGVVGVGLEYGFAPNWSAAVEYDHLFMSTTQTSSFSLTTHSPQQEMLGATLTS
jgi:outer membrane immunogenic protein